MSHCYYVKCRCGNTTGHFNKGEQDLIDAVKQSYACHLLSKTDWEMYSLEWKSGYRGLAAFLGSHFSHGGFEVCGDYHDDKPVSVAPTVPKEVLRQVYHTQLQVELDDLLQRAENLKKLLEQQ